jgi:hypothetical protein
VENFNKQFAYTIKDTQNAFEKLDTTLKINQLFSKHTVRTVSARHSIKYKNHSYRFINENGEQVYLLRNSRVMVIEARNEQLINCLNDNLYVLEVIEDHEAVSKEFDLETSEQVEKTTKKPYIPAISHPWKAQSYQNYLNKLSKKQYPPFFQKIKH